MIKLTHCLHLFSHRPGIQCLIPGTSYIVEAFPALIRIFDREGTTLKEVSLKIEGPLQQFTCLQDLERGCVTLWSECYRFHILPDLSVVSGKYSHQPLFPSMEKLFLGVHKQQEWEKIKERGDFREIFPFWFRLGKLLSLPPFPKETAGTFFLLKECQEVILTHRPEAILSTFKKLFLVGFKQLLIPRLNDEEFQGILPFEIAITDTSPLYLLQEGAKLIRSLFFLGAEAKLSFLPNLPPEFFSGRLINLTHEKCSIDMEWTKKMIRRVVIRSHQNSELMLHFPASIRHFRVRNRIEEKGSVQSIDEPLVIKRNSVYLLDRFQK